jgi:N,N'-diacetyllegionaminate synthase
MEPVLIIAEAGVNHNGSFEIAKRLVDEAAKAKVDYVKFQTWVTEDLVDPSAPKAEYQKTNAPEFQSQYEMLKNLELSFENFRQLKKYCEEKGVKFLSTPDEEKSLNFLVDELNVDLIKVGSGEVNNLPYLMQIGAKKRNVILSTGMSTLGEVERARDVLLAAGASAVSLLHCTSEYPAPFNEINLKAMNTLQNAFKCDVGYSDHSVGIEVSIAAVAMGAKIIEKHFTLDKNLPGPDHKASMDPVELCSLVTSIRNVEKAVAGDGIKKPTPSELETKKVVQKGIYSRGDLKKGDRVSLANITTKRPVNGLPAESIEMILGRKMSKALKAGDPINLSDLDFSN